MGRASFITLATIVVLLVAGAVGVYAYDSARSDVVVEGVTVGGVDIGGMTAGEARAALKEELGSPLEKPVEVSAGGRTWKLSAKRAKVRTDIDAMVEEAVAISREGNVVSRAFRDLRGGSEPAALESHVSYSDRAVEGLVRDVKRAVDRPAQDATVEPSGSGLEPVRSQKGVELQAAELKRAVGSELRLPGERRVKARTESVKPSVTTDEVAEEYPTYITVDREAKQLRFYRNLKLDETYDIAVGRAGYETPAGLYDIESKAVDPAWSVPEWGGSLAGKTIPGGAANNPLKSRWLGIYDGAGIHGTSDTGSLGSAASHGCIRMAIPEVEELYDKVPVDTPIYIS